MNPDQRKIALIGTGMVGMSYAYTLLHHNICDELVLIDADEKRAAGEAADLNHGLAFAPVTPTIYAGSYSDCKDADLAVICAGVAQRDGESRLSLLQRNADVLKSILGPLMKSGFSGLLLIASNPVDLMTRYAMEISGLPEHQVFGSGTTLDTARLRFLIGRYFHVHPHNVHAYVIGEHGDSEFVPWSQAMLATKPLTAVCEEYERCDFHALQDLAVQVRTSAQRIIEAKRATYYGIGMALLRITEAVFGDQNRVLTLSTMANGIYELEHTVCGLPCFVGRQGVTGLLHLHLTDTEQAKLQQSAKTLEEAYRELIS